MQHHVVAPLRRDQSTVATGQHAATVPLQGQAAQIARRLGDCPSFVCASPGYLASHGTPQHPRDPGIHNCLTNSYFGRSLWDFETADGEWVSAPVGGNPSANESQVLLAAATRGAGIVLQLVFSAAAHLSTGQLVALLPDYHPRTLGIHAVFQSRRQMPAVLRALLDFLAERKRAPRSSVGAWVD